ncbi:MAG: NAD-dependent epimerase/dehydratase family protein [Candidatus Brocadiae bacterium]|nr:NAD-dependent epimerase/dehydratase family protein [Candidatus Brocadiia bacterium]
MKNNLIVVAGGGGFIGGHLVASLRKKGYSKIRAVDIKPFDQWWQIFPDVENLQLDLKDKGNCEKALESAEEVYNLAADMGGMGFIENNKALCMLSVLINTHLLMAAHKYGVKRYFYSSSACVYAAEKQISDDVVYLKEEHAYPAMAEDGYGWEKLFSERMCRHFHEDFKLCTRVARYHNVYGPMGTWDGGREKAPAAICRKIIKAKLAGNQEIEIWGDGNQKRTFTYIDDCLYGTFALMKSDVEEPINIGSDEVVTINSLVDIVEKIAKIKLKRIYNLNAPKGVRSRASENTLIKRRLDWTPSIKLCDGMEKTYSWIYDQIVNNRPCPIY